MVLSDAQFPADSGNKTKRLSALWFAQVLFRGERERGGEEGKEHRNS